VLDRPEAATIRAQLEAAARWREGQALVGPYRENLPVEERIAGLSRIWAAARDGFAWFDHVPDLDWDRAYLDAIPRVMAAQDTGAYYLELMQFVALLRDGHSNVYPPEEIAKRFYSRPGVRTAKVEGRVIVMEVTDSDLSRQGPRVGDEVVSIDGIGVERYAQERVVPYQSSSTDQDRAVRAYSYALLSGSAERPVEIEVRDPDGKHTTLTALRSGYASTDAHPRKIFAMREDGIAVITALQFENCAAAESLGEHIAQVMQAKGLILDLRGNGGGSSNLGFALLSWLSDAPLPSMVSSYRDSNVLDRARTGKSVTVVWRNVAGQEFFAPRDPVFQGPVALLIDARTLSAAEDTAAVFKLMQRGIVVGSASGGSTGQPWLFDLPGGGQARICVKRDSYPDGTTFVGAGVVPDIEVPLTIKDVREGQDAVIERAVHELSKGRNLA
jgi:carboxyl-terminal processing protease